MVVSQFEPVRANLGQQVFQHLRDRIYHMEIEPGARLGVGEIASQLGVSRSPVRDAFHMLMAEGLVDVLPSGGYRVFELNRKVIEDVFVVRRSLELTAIRLCVQHLDVERVQALRAFWVSLKALDDHDPQALDQHMNADTDLHRGIADMSQNQLLRDSLDRIIAMTTMIRRWQYGGGMPHRHLSQTAQEHIGILDAILEGDADKAVAVLGDHLDLAYQRSLARLEVVSKPSPNVISENS